jgi:hypothetical protein
MFQNISRPPPRWDKLSGVNAWLSRGFPLILLWSGLGTANVGVPRRTSPDSVSSGAPPAARFELKGEVAVDPAAHLIWQRCSVGQRWKDDGCVGVIRQMTWQEAKQLEKDGWRLPSKDELLMLVSPSAEFAIDPRVFPDLEFNKLWYWTGTAGESSAWYVAFGGGSAHLGARSDRNSVRLVKSG